MNRGIKKGLMQMCYGAMVAMQNGLNSVQFWYGLINEP